MAHKHHPALRSGIYSALSVLPGESKAKFRKLHQKLILEYAPDGVSEDDAVFDIARLMWRKENLGTYLLSFQARRLRHQKIQQRLWEQDAAGPDWEEQAKQEAEREVRKELGSDSVLLDLGPMITDKGLNSELDLIERFDDAIGRRIKRLLQLKAMKQAVPLARGVAKLPELQAPSIAAPDPEIIPPPKQRHQAVRD